MFGLLVLAAAAALLLLRAPLAVAIAVPLGVACFFIGRAGAAPRPGVTLPPGEAASAGPALSLVHLDSLPVPAMVTRGDRLVAANRLLHRMLSREPGSLDGTLLEDLCAPGDGPVLRALIANAESPRDLPLLSADGTGVWVQAAAARLPDRESTLATAVDIRGRRESEQKCRELGQHAHRLEEQLEHSTRLAELGGMSAAISHELNQPLTGIRNYARNAFYMLEQRPGAEAEVKNNLRLISEQVDRASRIITQMRELTRRPEAAHALLDLNSVIRESLDFLLPQMKLSEVQVTLRLDDTLPPVWGDRVRLAQVFLNLLANARQAMTDCPARQLTVASSREPGAVLPLVVRVSDTGKGFTAEQAPQLFHPFYTTRPSGHGLGLSISRTIIHDHGGTIDAVGAPGAGATFTLRLPAAQQGAGRQGEVSDSGT